jgi:CoA-transferase family III
LTKVNMDRGSVDRENEDMTPMPFADTFRINEQVENGSVVISGEGSLPSAFDVTGFATAALASVALAAMRVSCLHGGTADSVTIDRRLASLSMMTTAFPIGWEPPSPWDDLAGDYEANDGWIRLHTNAAAHRKAALIALGCEPSKHAVAMTVRSWGCDEIESAVHAAGGVAGAMRSAMDWAAHPQGESVQSESLVDVRQLAHQPLAQIMGTPSRPLAGVRVLDFTKVLAGPIATRFLAVLGADVIRADAAEWAEPGLSHDTTVGKRCVHIDGRTQDGQNDLRELFASADIMVHGYRPGALESIGLGESGRRNLNPGIVEVCLNAYGHSGPWSNRRGFDSVVQMSCGIAEAGMRRFGRDKPTPLPVQALDHVTGFVMAAAALNGWAEKLTTGYGSAHRTSLARTASALMDGPEGDLNGTVRGVDLIQDSPDLASVQEESSWGPLRRMIPPFAIAGVDLRWDRPAVNLGSTPLPINWLR